MSPHTPCTPGLASHALHANVIGGIPHAEIPTFLYTLWPQASTILIVATSLFTTCPSECLSQCPCSYLLQLRVRFLVCGLGWALPVGATFPPTLCGQSAIFVPCTVYPCRSPVQSSEFLLGVSPLVVSLGSESDSMSQHGALPRATGHHHYSSKKPRISFAYLGSKDVPGPSFVSLQGLVVGYGSGTSVALDSCGNVTISSCMVVNNGEHGILATGTNLTVQDCQVNSLGCMVWPAASMVEDIS